MADNSLLLMLILPVVCVVCLALNLFIRARGGRSFEMNLKGFGIDLRIVSEASNLKEKDDNDE